jgi:NADPH:quinone reductase-like Zn-dependent oxidoreductase
MKAARFSRFGGPEVLEIVDLPDPHPGPGEVRIAVRAAGVNPSDWKKRQGLMDEELRRRRRAAGRHRDGHPRARPARRRSGSTLLINGASGSVGGAAVQLAVLRDARQHGVRFSRGDAGRAVHVLAEIGGLIESGRFSLPVAQTFPLADVAQAHRAGQEGHPRGKLVLLVGPARKDTIGER